MLDSKTLNYLYTLRRRGIKVGLHRTEALLSKCGDPHREIPVIHIAGTNGKGSTAAMIASILRESGRKVGLYTSPHLVRFNERVRINGIPIPDNRIKDFLKQQKKSIDALGSTFFETTTALTFSFFATEHVDVGVVEVGLGGRLDSSNVANTVVSVLTPIDYDHMEFLGSDLASIAREKCGILKAGAPVVTAPQRRTVMEVVRQSASTVGTDLSVVADVSPAEMIGLKRDATQFRVGKFDYAIPLLGRHQVTNAQTAITACRVFDSTIGTAHIRRGLKEVKWPGRLQKMSDDPLVFYDVAHNPHGLKAVLNTLEELFPRRNVAAVCALKKRKQIQPMAELLSEHCRRVVTTAPGHDGFFTPDGLALRLSQGGVRTSPAATVSEALALCSDEASPRDLWLIFGTHYMAESVFDEFHFSFDNEEF
ncbi:MAG: bifunctional folylpolyglutamate synthase/dihydrofolate synthase [Fidelibacterota bacterium]